MTRDAVEIAGELRVLSDDMLRMNQALVREAADCLTTMRAALLKAFTVVEWVAGEGFALSEPHFDADDLLLELVELLGVEDSEAARKRVMP